MFRYMVFVWNAADHPQSEAAQLLARRLQLLSSEWRSALDRNGVHVYYAGARRDSSEPYLLQNHEGAVLGTVFERSRTLDDEIAAKKAVFGPKQSAEIVATAGRHLVESYWGRYVAFLHDSRSDKKWVIRDPSGGVPCFSTTFRRVEIYFSCMEDCFQLGVMNFSINRRYVAARVVAGLVQSRETALNEVSTLQAGECVEFDRERVSKSFYWHPFRIVGADVIEDPVQAAKALRHTAKMCIQAWASCYSSILHRLSGGLDSSVVLGCLQNSPTRPKITCLNYYSSGCDGDERAFARLAAQGAGCELIERERDSQVDLGRMLHIARWPNPSSYLGYVQVSHFEAQLARECGATAIFGGGGGDQLFYQHPAMLAAADYIYRHGIRRSLFSVALDVARLEHTSIWKVLEHAVRDGVLGRQRWDPLRETYGFRKLVNPAVLDAVRNDNPFLHPWFQFKVRIPPGKLWHIYTLSFPQPFYDPLGQPDNPEHVEPLGSQPLVELCLRIPTYVLTVGGWDRAIARQAFAQEVPRAILRRRSKGGMEEHAKRILMGNIGFARELLLEGILVRERLLERHKLEEVLSGRPTTVVGAMAEIFDHLSTEAWLRTWTGAQQKAAA